MLYLRSPLWRILTALICFLPVAALAAPSVTDLRIGHNSERTRFVLEVSEPTEYRAMTLADPYRLVIDFPYLEWQVQEDEIDTAGAISAIRYGRFTTETSRVVLDLNGPAEAARTFTLPAQGNYPFRFVVDLKPTSRSTFMANIGKPGEGPSFQPRSTVEAAVPAPTRGKRVVVVDAGHGGIDPGTLGRYGPDEKHVTLAVAREVKRQLEATGRYTVVLTRDHDVFLPLRDRVDVARHANADLFVSVHADSIANRKVRGATVYTLSETASDKEAAALARKENRSDIIAGVNLAGESDDVTSILIDLAQRETMNHSAEFAQILIPQLSRSMMMRTNSHRFAGFAVLKAPDVPSVLVEMGYLSNSKDAEFIYSKKGQRLIAAAIIKATEDFFEEAEG